MKESIKLPESGDLFVNLWGTTMQRVVFYQLLSKEPGKNRYHLTTPISEYEGYSKKLVARTESKEAIAHAKMHRGRFVLCNSDFTIKDYCNSLRTADVGNSHQEWGD